MTRMTKTSRKKAGIVYVILVEMDGKSLVKIGVTHRKIEDRVSEILVSIFRKYREFPYCRPKRFSKTTDAYGKEKTLHKEFKEFKHKTSKPFSGSTEFFDVPLEDVVKAYDKLIGVKVPKKKPGVFFVANTSI